MKKIKLGTEVVYLHPHIILRSFPMFKSNVQSRVNPFHEPPHIPVAFCWIRSPDFPVISFCYKKIKSNFLTIFTFRYSNAPYLFVTKFFLSIRLRCLEKISKLNFFCFCIQYRCYRYNTVDTVVIIWVSDRIHWFRIRIQAFCESGFRGSSLTTKI
jgi:hypothetical protein